MPYANYEDRFLERLVMNKLISLEVMMNREYCTYSIRMPVTLRRQIEQLAAAQDRRSSQVVRRLIRLAYAEWARNSLQREETCHGGTQILEV